MGRPTERSADSLAKVEKGMRVVDAADEEIGTVDRVKLGDPEGVGFVRIDGSWVFGQAVYATPDQIGGVTGDTVRLVARKRELTMEWES